MLANDGLVHISFRQSAKRHACVRDRNFQSVQLNSAKKPLWCEDTVERPQ